MEFSHLRNRWIDNRTPYGLAIFSPSQPCKRLWL